MKTMETLSVTVTFDVIFDDVELPEIVYEQIKEAIYKGHTFDGMGDKYPEATQWLLDNVKPEDAMNWDAEVDNV